MATQVIATIFILLQDSQGAIHAAKVSGGRAVDGVGLNAQVVGGEDEGEGEGECECEDGRAVLQPRPTLP